METHHSRRLPSFSCLRPYALSYVLKLANEEPSVFSETARTVLTSSSSPRAYWVNWLLVWIVLCIHDTYVLYLFAGSLLRRRPSIILVLTCPLAMVQEAALEWNLLCWRQRWHSLRLLASSRLCWLQRQRWGGVAYLLLVWGTWWRQVFRVKKLVGLPPQLKILAPFTEKSLAQTDTWLLPAHALTVSIYRNVMYQGTHSRESS